MANLARVRVTWSGTPVVGPGLSTFYFAEAGSGWMSSLGTAFTAIVNQFPVGITWSAQNTGDLIDVATGELTGSWTDGVGFSVNATATGLYAQGVGARCKWRTSGIRGGRRVYGSTFLLPLIGSAYDTQGTIVTGNLNGLQAAMNGIVTASGHELGIWSRPNATGPGQFSPVTSGEVPDQISWLKSRRT